MPTIMSIKGSSTVEKKATILIALEQKSVDFTWHLTVGTWYLQPFKKIELLTCSVAKLKCRHLLSL